MTTYAIGRGRTAPVPKAAVMQTGAGLLVGLAVAGVTAIAISDGSLKAVAVLIVVAGTIWFAATRHTLLALALLMLYLGLLDGYLKLATGSGQITLVRDGLIFAIAAGLLIRAVIERRPLPMPPLSGWVIAFVVLVLVQLWNPNDGSIYHSLAGVRQHLEFVPLFFLTYAFIRTTRALRGFAVLLVLIGIANGVVGLIQFEISPAKLASWGPGYAERINGTGGFQQSGRGFYTTTGQIQNRPFGLGSDAGDGGLMGDFALGAVLALGATARRRRDYVLVVAGAVGAVTAIVTSQGRAAVVGGVIVLLVYAFLAATAKGGGRTLAALALAALAAIVAVPALVSGTSSTAFRYGGLAGTQLVQTTSNARGRSLASIPQHLRDYPFGDGLGIAGPATGVSGGPPQAGAVDAENEISFAIAETGIAGMLALVGFTVVIVAIGVRRLRSEADQEVRLLLAAVIAPVGAMLALYSVNTLSPTTPGGPYLWAAGGIVAYWLVKRFREMPARSHALDSH
jgi:hypothetical protein